MLKSFNRGERFVEFTKSEIQRSIADKFEEIARNQLFGQTLADFQATRFALADMQTELDASRLLVYRAAWLKDNNVTEDFLKSVDLNEARQELEFQSRLARTSAPLTESQTQIIRSAVTAEEKHSTSRTQSANSIVVLPFTNISTDEDNEYFSDGLTEVLTGDLSKISSLFVIARNSAFTYKGKPVKVQEVSKELGVRYVLEGSIRKADDQVRINAQLIDATTGAHQWAERYDRPFKDIFAAACTRLRTVAA
jgi:TolB-like protein